MTNDQEDRVRQRAHEIWEREGHPQGRHDEHWRQALEELQGEGAQMDSLRGVSSDPAQDAPKRRRKPADDAATPATRPRKPRAPAAEGSDATPAPRKRAAKAAADSGAEAGGSPPPSRRGRTKATGSQGPAEAGEAEPVKTRARKSRSEGSKEDGAPPG